MDNNWVEVTDVSILRDILGIESPTPTDPLYSAITALADDDDPDGWWKSKLDFGPKLPRGAIGYLIPKTRFFFNVTEAKKVGGDILVAAAVYLQIQNFPLSAALGVLRNLKNNLKVLTVDEVEVVRVIMGKAGLANPYSVGIPEERIKASYADAAVDIDALLTSLERKKVIEQVRVGKIRLVR